MNKTKILAKSVALACIGAAGIAQAGMYVGVGGGAVRLDPDLESGIAIEDDGRDEGYKAVVGKRMGKRGRIELFYADLGTAVFDPLAEVDYTSYGVNTVWDVWGGGRGSKKPKIFVSLGIGGLETEDNTTGGSNILPERSSDVLTTAGIGASFGFRHGFSLRTTLEVFDRDASMASALLIKDFGGHRGAHSGKCAHGDLGKMRKKHKKHCAHHGAKGDMAEVMSVPAIETELAAAKEPAAAVVEQTPAVDVKKSAGSNLAQLKNAYFNRDSAFITEMSVDVLEQLLKTMNDYPKMRVEIQGHSDAAESGSARALSELRAQRVSNYLWRKGISPKRLSLIAYGSSQPAADESGDRLNRRVQFRILTID